MQDWKTEHIGGGVKVYVSDLHTFGTDSFLLSYFASPKRKDVACDLGTGCGIIPLLWFRDPDNRPKHAFAVDVQEQAAAQARRSVESSELSDLVTVVHADLCTLKSLEGGTVDLVTCNPPYKAANTGLISRNPQVKIARHETLCTLDDVCACAARLLRFGGRLYLSQLPERLVDVLDAMRRNRIEPKRIRFVQQRWDTAPWLFLVEGKRGAKPFLTIDPPLILEENGGTSAEMCRIYADYGKVEPGDV